MGQNHYHYVGPFADYLANIYSNTPDDYTDAKDFTLQNMYEEELADIRHTDLLIKFAEACGTTKERVEDPNNMNAVTRGLQAWCYAVSQREHFVVATAALVVGLESQVPSIYKKQIVPLREVYGFTEDEIDSSICTLRPTSCTVSAATRSSWTAPTHPSCSSVACSSCGGVRRCVFVHQGPVRLLRRARTSNWHPSDPTTGGRPVTHDRERGAGASTGLPLSSARATGEPCPPTPRAPAQAHRRGLPSPR